MTRINKAMFFIGLFGTFFCLPASMIYWTQMALAFYVAYRGYC